MKRTKSGGKRGKTDNTSFRNTQQGNQSRKSKEKHNQNTQPKIDLTKQQQLQRRKEILGLTYASKTATQDFTKNIGTFGKPSQNTTGTKERTQNEGGPRRSVQQQQNVNIPTTIQTPEQQLLNGIQQTMDPDGKLKRASTIVLTTDEEPKDPTHFKQYQRQTTFSSIAPQQPTKLGALLGVDIINYLKRTKELLTPYKDSPEIKVVIFYLENLITAENRLYGDLEREREYYDEMMKIIYDNEEIQNILNKDNILNYLVSFHHDIDQTFLQFLGAEPTEVLIPHFEHGSTVQLEEDQTNTTVQQMLDQQEEQQEQQQSTILEMENLNRIANYIPGSEENAINASLSGRAYFRKEIEGANNKEIKFSMISIEQPFARWAITGHDEIIDIDQVYNAEHNMTVLTFKLTVPDKVYLSPRRCYIQDTTKKIYFFIRNKKALITKFNKMLDKQIKILGEKGSNEVIDHKELYHNRRAVYNITFYDPNINIEDDDVEITHYDPLNKRYTLRAEIKDTPLQTDNDPDFYLNRLRRFSANSGIPTKVGLLTLQNQHARNIVYAIVESYYKGNKFDLDLIYQSSLISNEEVMILEEFANKVNHQIEQRIINLKEVSTILPRQSHQNP